MKFLQALGSIEGTSYYTFMFEQHDLTLVCCGDSIWSDGTQVQIAEWVDEDDLQDLIEQVDNSKAFKGALRRCGILGY